ncbi:MAG: Activator of osmoprotectant transporter ProP [Halomonas sp. HL-48]|nr:MAG: Activator of osmoprotectant transporter ProP [Halomonas sp. HL-48]
MTVSPDSASPRQLLDDLERRWELAQTELIKLREENAELKRLLAQIQEGASSEASEPATHDNADRPAPATSSSTDKSEDAQASDGDALPLVPVEKDEPPSPHALLAQWYQRYPKAFFKGHTQPLKVGIHHDLAACEPWSGKLIRRALANYVNLPRYIKSVREGAKRIDLEGNEAGVVDAEAARHAAEKRAKQAAALPKEENKIPKDAEPRAKTAKPNKKSTTQTAKKAEKTPPERDIAHKQLSMEDKLLGLKQKFQGR